MIRFQMKMEGGKKSSQKNNHFVKVFEFLKIFKVKFEISNSRINEILYFK